MAGYHIDRLQQLVQGLSRILQAAQLVPDDHEACAFSFQREELLVGKPSLFNEEELAQLKELGFNVNEDDDHFYVFS
jgi:hypothetical protein